MKIPAGVRVCCAADLFEYDEAKTLNLRKFFSYYRDQFPMLMVIIGGHYGDTKFDCYDNLQVLRVHCYSSQPRVVADDPRLNPRCQTGYITIPEDTLIKFRLVKGHTKLGNPQPLKELLQENDRLPLLVQMACDPRYPIRVGTSKYVAKDFGTIMIKEKFTEHFYMMNCVDGVELDLNKLICMACLSEDLDAAPVTGFKYGSKAEFDEFCRKLAVEVAESGEEYDCTQGNDDFSEYTFDEMRHLLETSDNATGTLPRDEEGADVVEIHEDEYEEIAPLVPSRNPIARPGAKESEANTQQDKKTHSKPSPPSKPSAPLQKQLKSPKVQDKGKDSKSAFGFLKKKHRGEHLSIEEEEEKTLTEAVNPIKSTNTTDNEHPQRPPPKIMPHIKTVPSPASQSKVSQNTKGDTNAGYVTLAAHKNYQNTKIGRATVKPMRQISNNKQDEEYQPMKNIEKGEEQEYELLDEVSTMQADTSAVERKRQQNQQKPLLKELEKKLAGQDKQPDDSPVEDNGEEYEDLGSGKGTQQGNDGYTEPRQHASRSKSTSSNRQSPREQRHQEIPRRENIQSNTEEGQSAKELAEFNVNAMSIKDIGEHLKALKLGQYAEVFEENQVDGEILASLSVEDLQTELGLKKLEAIRLHKFAISGHVPK